MILGVDVGTRTPGWAVVTVAPEPVAVVELGELYQDDTDHANAARVHAQALLLDGLVARHGITRIAGEARSLGGPPKARVSMAAAQSCCWGMLAALAALRGLELAEVGPKVWQAAVLGRADDLDYEEVAAVLSACLTGLARAQLAVIPAGRRNHALDAAGVGMFAAAWPHGAEVVARARMEPTCVPDGADMLELVLTGPAGGVTLLVDHPRGELRWELPGRRAEQLIAAIRSRMGDGR